MNESFQQLSLTHSKSPQVEDGNLGAGQSIQFNERVVDSNILVEMTNEGDLALLLNECSSQ